MIAPILMKPDECINITLACERAERSYKTMLRWIKRYGIGRKGRFGIWMVSLPALSMVMHGEFGTLEKLRAGERSAPEVRRYFEFLGLPG